MTLYWLALDPKLSGETYQILAKVALGFLHRHLLHETHPLLQNQSKQAPPPDANSREREGERTSKMSQLDGPSVFEQPAKAGHQVTVRGSADL